MIPRKKPSEETDHEDFFNRYSFVDFSNNTSVII